MARRGKSHDYMMRSEKRPNQRPASAPVRRKRRKSSRHPLYALLTALLLVVLYPVGLVLLWMRKLRWRSSTKLFLSLITGVIFFVLCAFALNAQVDNPLITNTQTRVKQQLTHVTSAVRTAVSNKEAIEHNLYVEGPQIIHMISDGTTQALVTGVPEIGENLRMLYARAGLVGRNILTYIDHEGRELLYSMNLMATPSPTALPITTLAPTPEPTPDATPEPTPDATPESTPDATPESTPDATPESTPDATPESTPGATPDSTPGATGTISPRSASTATAQPTSSPAATPSASTLHTAGAMQQSPRLSPSVSPTPATPPTPTVNPTPALPTPTPIVLPKVQAFGESTVYFYDASKFYHMNPTCNGMNNAPARTLTEASELGKRRCSTCKPPELSLLDADMVVWCGTDEVFHITKDCEALTETFSGLTFDEAWLEDAMSGCPLCGADLYVDFSKLSPNATPAPAPSMPEA